MSPYFLNIAHTASPGTYRHILVSKCYLLVSSSLSLGPRVSPALRGGITSPVRQMGNAFTAFQLAPRPRAGLGPAPGPHRSGKHTYWGTMTPSLPTEPRESHHLKHLSWDTNTLSPVGHDRHFCRGQARRTPLTGAEERWSEIKVSPESTRTKSGTDSPNSQCTAALGTNRAEQARSKGGKCAA